MPELNLSLPDFNCPIAIGPGGLDRLGATVRDVAGHDRAVLLTDTKVTETHGAAARAGLEAAGFEVVTTALVADEKRKTLETVRGLYDQLMAWRIERRTPIVAVGGGLVGDIAGFVAATWLRGVPVIQVPTTLLAMVDASIGGKTAVNLPLDDRGERLSKNIVGAFWQPRAIVSDPETLTTLPKRELRSGLAECLKHAVLEDPALLNWIRENHAAIDAVDISVITELVARSAAIKVSYVERDERESGLRARLNLGHTFAHAIEPRPELDLRHGEAVAIGLCAAARLSEAVGRLASSDREQIEAAIAQVGLPVRLARAVPIAELIESMGVDKKVAGGTIRFVLPEAIGRVVHDVVVDRSVVESVWCAVGAEG